MEGTRNTGEGDSNDNPRGQYPIPFRRSIDQSKKEKEKESFGIRNNGLEAQVGRELELGDRQTPGYQETRGTTVPLLFEVKPV